MDSGTGPDRLPSRILKMCSTELALPVLLLAERIVETGFWPTPWILHWVVPLYKKKSVYSASNYRGIHLTAQLSKVLERLMQKLFVPYLSKFNCFGPSQVAYTRGRGSRDALAYLVLTWLQALASALKIGVYCSDVSGAFDKVSHTRLLAKLRVKGFYPKLVAIIASWLRQRTAHVVVGCKQSEAMQLQDMIFQGTVLGPMLWNLFYEDARHALRECFFKEIVYADALNGFRFFSQALSNTTIQKCINMCQKELHMWGCANQVGFDPGKESKHILSLTQPEGGVFTILGVTFDGKLDMTSTVDDLVATANWKIGVILRTHRFYKSA